jgi:hypothetical protein
MIYFLNLFPIAPFVMIRQTIAKLRLGSVLGWLFIGAVVLAAANMLLHPKKLPEKPEPRPRTEMDLLAERVHAINANLFRLFFTGFSPMRSPPIDCAIADRLELNDRSADERRLLEPKAQSARDRCNIASVVNAQIMDNFRSIADQGTLPESLYAFEVYLDADWTTVGIFLSRVQCEEAQARSAEIGLGVKTCQEWKPRY